MVRARDAALQALMRVESGQAFAAAALNAVIGPKGDPREAALATELVLGVLRRRPWLDRLLDSASTRGLGKIDPLVRQTLRIGAYQIAFLERVPARAAVFEAVAQVKKRNPRLSGLVNAVLRRLAGQEASALDPSFGMEPGTVDDAACRLGLPAWFYQRLIDSQGLERAWAIATAYNEPSRRTLRLNPLRVSRAEVVRKLGDQATPGVLSPWSIDVSSPSAAAALVDDGLAINQDEGSQLAVLALDPKPDFRILDMCAGRGGKTATLAVATEGRANITAADKAANKLDRLEFELHRQGLSARTVCVDLVENPDGIDPGFDRILLDAPCSGSGTLGRRPEIRWRLKPKPIRDLAAVQQQLLNTAAGLLKPGGRLVYAVCSILPEEGPGHLGAFLDRHPEFCTVKAQERSWPDGVPWQDGSVFVDPSRTSTDGYQLLVLDRQL